jgi:hypothetical protein
LDTAFPIKAVKSAGCLKQRLSCWQHLIERQQRADGEILLAGCKGGVSRQGQCGRFLEEIAKAGERSDNRGVG